MRRLLVTGLCVLLPLLAHAGAWGSGSFENDDALDWIGDCADGRADASVSAAFAAVLSGDYIQAPEGSAAVAAAEVLASAVGKPPSDPPTELAACVKRLRAENVRTLAATARQALARVLDPKISELSQLWAEAESEAWRRKIADLQARLARSATRPHSVPPNAEWLACSRASMCSAIWLSCHGWLAISGSYESDVQRWYRAENSDFLSKAECDGPPPSRPGAVCRGGICRLQ